MLCNLALISIQLWTYLTFLNSYLEFWSQNVEVLPELSIWLKCFYPFLKYEIEIQAKPLPAYFISIQHCQLSVKLKERPRNYKIKWVIHKTCHFRTINHWSLLLIDMLIFSIRREFALTKSIDNLILCNQFLSGIKISYMTWDCRSK